MSENTVRERHTRSFEISGSKGKVTLDIGILDIEREVAEQILKQVDCAKDNIDRILAGESGKDNR